MRWREFIAGLGGAVASASRGNACVTERNHPCHRDPKSNCCGSTDERRQAVGSPVDQHSWRV